MLNTSDYNKGDIAEFAMSGTLGDAFIVFCKLSDYHKRTGNKVRLYHYTKYPEFGATLQRFFNLSPYIEYVYPPTYMDGPYNVDDCRRMAAPHVNIFWDGKGQGVLPDDPPEIGFDPFPQIQFGPVPLEPTKCRVGIQLHSGKFPGNFKGFSLRWVSAICRSLESEQFRVHLFGTAEGYRQSAVDHIARTNGVSNLVGKLSFEEWLKHVAAMDFFITPEGLPAFWAMSQRVRSLVFFDFADILARIPPEWRESHVLMSSGRDGFLDKLRNRIVLQVLGRSPMMAPLKVNQVRSLILSKTVFTGTNSKATGTLR